MITFAPIGPGDDPKTFDGYDLSDALQKLLDQGAACVGVNCARGPKTMIPIMKHMKEKVKVCIYQVKIHLLSILCVIIKCTNFQTKILQYVIQGNLDHVKIVDETVI